MKISKDVFALAASLVVMGSMLLLASRLSDLMFNRLLVCSLIVTLIFVVRSRGKVSDNKPASPGPMNPNS